VFISKFAIFGSKVLMPPMFYGAGYVMFEQSISRSIVQVDCYLPRECMANKLFENQPIPADVQVDD
jgi:hypothetical protein